MKKITASLTVFLFFLGFFVFSPKKIVYAVTCDGSSSTSGDTTISTSCTFPTSNDVAIVSDSSTSGNTGTATGTTIVEGINGSARSFNGSSDYITTGDLTGLNTGNQPHTISAWIKPTATPTTRQWPLLLGEASTGNHHWTYNSSGVLAIGVWSGGAGSQCNVSVTPGEWSFVSATLDGTNINCYKNGNLVSSGDEASTLNLTNTSLKLAQVQIAEAYYNGTIDDVSIYAYARSPEQILEDMNRSTNPTGNAPIAHWAMDDGYVSGVDGGNVTVSEGNTLTINAGQSFVWNPGSSITIEDGASIVINSNSQLRQSYLWVSDGNSDGWIYDATVVASDVQPSGYVRRNSIIGSTFGNGLDGSITFNTNTNLNTTAVAAGRTDADAKSYAVTAMGTNTVTAQTSTGNPITGHWNMNEASGTTLDDASTNSNDATAIRGEYMLNTNGYPTTQLFIGPWAASSCSDTASHQTDIENSSPTPSGSYGGDTWASATDADGNFNWDTVICGGDCSNQYAYSHIYLYVPYARTIRFKFGSDDASQLWVNGALEYTKTACEGVVIDKYSVDIAVNQGWNKVLWKVVDGGGSYGLAYRITDTSNNGLMLPYRITDPTASSTAVPVVSGQYGNARSFDGVRDIAFINSTFGLGNTNATIALWVNLDSTSEDGSFVRIGPEDGYGYGIGVGASTFADSGNNLILLYGNVRWIDTNVNIGTGWHHVAMTIDGSGVPRAYIDGSLLNSYSGSNAVAPSGITQIGGYGGGGNDRFVDADIDDMRIYNYARTDTQIVEDMNNVTSNVTGFAQGDDAILINLQGDATNNGNVGNYEFLKVQSVSDSIITFNTNIQKIYGATTLNSNLTGQKVVVQRIPQYQDVTIADGISVTANAWDGSSGGVLAIKVSGTFTANSGAYGGGYLSMADKGYRGGDCNGCGDAAWGDQGEGIGGTGSGSLSANLNGGGGGYGPSGFNGDPGAGGGHASAGSNGTTTNPSNGSHTSTGGQAMGSQDLTTIFMGGGAGAGGDNDNITPLPEYRDGGGIIILLANTISSLFADATGEDATGGTGTAGVSGGGAGGSILIRAVSIVLDTVTSAGGAQYYDGTDDTGGAGSVGRNAIYYVSSLSGSTTPAAYASQGTDP